MVPSYGLFYREIRDETPIRPAATSYVIILARLHSTRLPRKVLLAETGKPKLQHTYEAVRTASKTDAIEQGSRLHLTFALNRG